MCDNYEQKLLQEIMRRIYQLVYIITQKNVGIIGILAYPKIVSLFVLILDTLDILLKYIICLVEVSYFFLLDTFHIHLFFLRLLQI